MTTYTKATNFASKDSLVSGNPLKTLKGTELDDEFNLLAIASATKADIASPTFTGAPAAPTATAGTDTTQVATTAFVEAAVTAVGIGSYLPKSGGAMTGAITTNSTFDGVDIATRDAVLTNTTATATAALPKAGGAMTGAITTNSTFDGVDIATRDAVLTTTADVALQALPKAGGAMTGAITTNSTFDGVDVATRDGVLTATTTTANAALPKAGGTMTGAVTTNSSINNFTLTAPTTAATLNTRADNLTHSLPAVSGNLTVEQLQQTSKSAAYTTVLGDAGTHILHPAADTTARTFTIPANASVAYPLGTAITFINENAGGIITIAITSDTMRLAGFGTVGSRTLAANGICTAVKITSTSWIISGMGLS